MFLSIKDPRERGVGKLLSLDSRLAWHCGVTFCCLASAGFLAYETTFGDTLVRKLLSQTSTSRRTLVFLIFLDTWCLLDLVLGLVHRLGPKRSLQWRPSRPWCFLLLNLVTCWPALTLHYILPSARYFAPVVYARTYRLFSLLYRLWSAVIFFNHAFLYFVTVQLVILFVDACCFYHFFWEPNGVEYAFKTYFSGDEYTYFNNPWPLDEYGDRFLISLYVAVQVFCKQAIHFFSAHSGTERALLLTVVFVQGMAVTLLKAALVLTSVERERNHRRVFRRYMDEEHAKSEESARFWRYVNTLWKERRGLIMSRLIIFLPPGLRFDARLDTYWEALSHSCLLKGLDRHFLGTLATRMVTEFHASGDYIYDSLAVKNKMIYVKKGVVEILSPEDGDTVLFSFGAGTCLGEASLVVPYPNVAVLRCATYCEIQTLTKEHIADLYTKFPDQFKVMADWMAIMFLEGKKARKFGRDVQKAARRMALGRTRSDPTRWVAVVLDKLWRVSKAASPTDKIDVRFVLDQLEDIFDKDYGGRNGRLINHLHKLAPVKLRDYREDAVFLTKECPLKLYPDSPLTVFSECVVCFAVLLLLLIIPYKAAVTASAEEDLFTGSIQLAFLFDIIVQSVRTVRFKGFLITDTQAILNYRMFDPRFQASAVSLIPFYYIVRGYANAGGPYFAIFKCYQLINWWRVMEMYNRFEDTLLVGRKLWRCFLVSVVFGYCSYATGMAYLMSSCFNRECDPKGWWATSYGPLPQYSNYKVTLYAMGQGLMIITGAPLYNTKPHTMSEYTALTLLSLSALFLNVKCLAWMTGSIVAEEEVKFRVETSVTVIRYVLAKRATGASLQQRATDYLRAIWDYSRGYGVFKSTRMRPEDLDPSLNSELKCSQWLDLALRVDLFKYFGERFIGDILRTAQYVYLPPNEVLVYRGQVVNWVLLLDKGYCELLSDDGSSSLKAHGVVFCLVESIFSLPCLCTIKSKTSCTLLKIGKEDIFRAMASYPYDYRAVMEAVKEGALLLNLPCVDISANKAADELFLKPHSPSICRPFETTGRRKKEQDNKQKIHIFWYDKLFKYFLWKIIILQTGRLFLIWEIFRCCMALVSAMVFPAHFIISLYTKKAEVFFWFLDTTAYLDIYFKFHVGRYKEGVLIKDTVISAKRYIRFWFWFDLAACLPLQLAINNYFLGNFNRILQINRVFTMLTTLRSDVTKTRGYVVYPWFLLLILVFTNAVTNALIYTRCKEGTGGGNVVVIGGILSCHFDNWSDLGYTAQLEVDRLILILFYWVSAVVMQTRQSVLVLQWFETEPAFICSIVLSVVIILYFISAIAAVMPVESTLVHHYQTKIARMKSFLDSHKVNDKLKKHFMAHYRLCWSNLLGMSHDEIFEPFPFGLKQDILLKIYGETLSHHSIFEVAEAGFFRSLLNISRVSFLVKGSTVIRPKDVNEELYLIHRGFAKVVYTSGVGHRILGRGYMFGKMNENQMFHLQEIIAESDVEILVFDSTEFHHILKMYPRIKQVFDITTFLDQHNVHSRRCAEEEKESYIEEETAFVEDLIISVKFWEVIKLVLSITVYSWAIYMIGTQNVTTKVLVTAYTLEALNMSAIFMSYAPWLGKATEEALLKSFFSYYERVRRQMYIDIAAAVPLELIYLFAVHFRVSPLLFTMLRLNRVLLLFTVKEFCVRNSLSLGVAPRAAVRLILTTLIIMMLIHTAASAVTFSLVLEQGFAIGGWQGFELYGKALKNVLCCLFKYGLSINVNLGSRLMQGVEICLIVLMVPLAGALVRECVILFRLTCRNALYYSKESRKLNWLMKVVGSSSLLIDIVHNYSWKLFTEKGGEQLPELILQAPRYLYMPLTESVFGHHLEHALPFLGVDWDVVKQLCALLKPYTYFPGNVAVRAGVADCSMYFVHEGTLEVVTAVGQGHHEEVVLRTLTKGGYFGVIQGLFPKAKHTANYRARTTVLILKLEYQDWKHYLDIFPVARNLIYSRYENVNMKQT